MAGVGEQVRSAPDAQGGRADPAALGEHTDLLPSPDHKRRGRRAEQQDQGHQAEGLRLQEPGSLRDRDLLLLRRLGPLSGKFLAGATHGKSGRTPNNNLPAAGSDVAHNVI